MAAKIARAQLTLHDKHYGQELLALWCNDSGDDGNGVVLMISNGTVKHSIGLSFDDAENLAKFLKEGHT